MASKKILIADDDLKLLTALKVRLEAEGFEVMTTRDAYQALSFTVQHKPDLIVLDVNMPAGMGFSVQERLQQNNGELSQIPVVYITGESPDQVDQTAQELGAVAVIHKPFETDHLLETVRGALGYWTAQQHPEYIDG